MSGTSFQPSVPVIEKGRAAFDADSNVLSRNSTALADIPGTSVTLLNVKPTDVIEVNSLVMCSISDATSGGLVQIAVNGSLRGVGATFRSAIFSALADTAPVSPNYILTGITGTALITLRWALRVGSTGIFYVGARSLTAKLSPT